jgi:hypothetical protein
MRLMHPFVPIAELPLRSNKALRGTALRGVSSPLRPGSGAGGRSFLLQAPDNAANGCIRQRTKGENISA